MFILDSFFQATGCIKSIVCCLCCLLIGGPVLVIVGAVLLYAEGIREDDVKAYNTAVTDYAANASKVNAWTGTVNNVSASVTSVTDQIHGNTDGITTTGVSRVTVANNVPIAANYQFTLGTVDPFIVSGINDSQLRCPGSHCTTYGYSGPGTCGVCYYPVYLVEACVVIGRNSNGATMGTYEFSRDTSKQSCFYPFTISSNKYSTRPSISLKMTARKYDDPYLVLQRVSEGAMGFYDTGEKATIGVILLAIGIVLTVIVCASCVLVYMCCLRAPTNSTTAQVGVIPVTTTTVTQSTVPYVSNTQQEMVPMRPTPLDCPVYGQPIYLRDNGDGYTSIIHNPPGDPSPGITNLGYSPTTGNQPEYADGACEYSQPRHEDGKNKEP